jgi:hypothetical protein
MLLDGVVKEYEKRFGAQNVEGPTSQGGSFLARGIISAGAK